jgi:hypothetical protein
MLPTATAMVWQLWARQSGVPVVKGTEEILGFSSALELTSLLGKVRPEGCNEKSTDA